MTRSLAEIGRAVKRLQMHHHRTMNARLEPLGLSIVQWDALRHLDENPGASLHRLAQLTFQTDQAFGALAARMIDRGLIERVPGPGRAVRHRLTTKGVELRRAGGGMVEEVLSTSFAPLDRARLAAFDATLLDLLDALEPPRATPTDDD